MCKVRSREESEMSVSLPLCTSADAAELRVTSELVSGITESFN
jgi:hypothetical protein